MTESYIREHLDQLDLKEMSYYNVFSMDFIRQFRDQIDPDCTLQYGINVPKEFWREMGYDNNFNINLGEGEILYPKKL